MSSELVFKASQGLAEAADRMIEIYNEEAALGKIAETLESLGILAKPEEEWDLKFAPHVTKESFEDSDLTSHLTFLLSIKDLLEQDHEKSFMEHLNIVGTALMARSPMSLLEMSPERLMAIQEIKEVILMFFSHPHHKADARYMTALAKFKSAVAQMEGAEYEYIEQDACKDCTSIYERLTQELEDFGKSLAEPLPENVPAQFNGVDLKEAMQIAYDRLEAALDRIETSF